jgi:hypothetical protein
MDLRNVTPKDLDAKAGKTITDFCSVLTAADLNHCAHFVSHALDITVGMRCGNMRWATRGTGVSIRVDEIFNYCTDRGPWASLPNTHNACLIFVTLAGNVTTSAGGLPTMGDQPRKHIGIHISGHVWHYSNGQDFVIRETVSAFETRFRGTYGTNIALFYGYRQDI